MSWVDVQGMKKARQEKDKKVVLDTNMGSMNNHHGAYKHGSLLMVGMDVRMTFEEAIDEEYKKKWRNDRQKRIHLEKSSFA